MNLNIPTFHTTDSTETRLTILRYDIARMHECVSNVLPHILSTCKDVSLLDALHTEYITHIGNLNTLITNSDIYHENKHKTDDTTH